MDVSESVGLGLWQLPVILVSLYRGIPSAMLMMNYNFAASKTPFWCRNDTGGEPNTFEASIIVSNLSEELGECLKSENGVVTNCDAWNFDHSVFSWTLVEEWDLVCERSWLRPLSQSLYLIGMLFGNLIFPQVSDRFGRKVSVLLSSVMMLIFGFLGAFSISLAMFNATRFLAALGTGGIQSTSVTLFVETLPSRNRVLFVATYGFGWTVGQLGTVALAYAIRNWRHLQMASGLFALPLIVLWWFVSESPRWLLTQGREEAAMKELRRAAKINKSVPPDLTQLSELLKRQSKVAKLKTPTLLDLLKGSKLRVYTFVMLYTFFAQRILYFHLSYAAVLIGGDQFLNYTIVQFMELPGKALGIVATIYFPRKACLIIFFVCGAIAFLVALAFPKDSIWGMVAVSAVAMLFGSANLELLCIYAAEVFPTCVRTIGVGSAYMASRVGSALAPFVSSIEDVAPRGVMEASVSGMQIIAALTLLLTPESFRKRLPDSLEDAELPFRSQGANIEVDDRKESENGLDISNTVV
uniref:Putative organic cation/carnitine transporter n=1 Tax=Ixodes scapularis TaxID=6945 RepID=A0A4D5S1U4_IXOSC